MKKGPTPIKSGSTLFLKFTILFIAIGALTGMLWFPQAEGRAASLDLISIYTDPFIIYIYIASIPFFFGLYQAFKLLNFIDTNRVFSQGAVTTLKNMKFASVSLHMAMIQQVRQCLAFLRLSLPLLLQPLLLFFKNFYKMLQI
jgi:hypothetical protein